MKISTGFILYLLLGLLIYLGLAQRVLDRLYLTDNTALLIIGAIIAGSFINFTIYRKPLLIVNVGGALIPLVLAFYVLFKANSKKEIIRTIAASLLTGAVIYLFSLILKNYGEGRDIIDPMYIYILSGGLFAYITGRTRRGSFVAGVLGYTIYNLIQIWNVITKNLSTEFRIGGAGFLDTIILSGLIGVILAEIIGETSEKISKGDE